MFKTGTIPDEFYAKRHQPWITRHIKQISHKKGQAYNHARSTGNAKGWSSYQDIKRQSQQGVKVPVK